MRRRAATRTTSVRSTCSRGRSPCWNRARKCRPRRRGFGQTYEPFQYRTLLQVSAALGVPYAYLSNDMLKANYSNSRLALLEFRRRIEAYQHAVIVWQLCRQVWARWMDTVVIAGALDLPNYDQRRREYLACGWLPPKWDWVDPTKDTRAEIEQIEAGLKSRTQALADEATTPSRSIVRSPPTRRESIRSV